MGKWKYALATADQSPPSAAILLNGTIEENLARAARLGYDAIEAHIREDAVIDYASVQRTMQETGVRVSMIVTGRLNTEGKCSLIADEPYVAAAAMDGMYQYIDMAQHLGADIIVGWVRGNLPSEKNRKKYLDRLAGNLKILSAYAVDRNVKILIEVINRYEMDLFTTAEELMSFLENYQLENCYAHLDTFHMGIEEVDPVRAIGRCADRLMNIHLSDNTRCYPGSGRFDFQKIFMHCKKISIRAIYPLSACRCRQVWTLQGAQSNT